MLSEIEVEVNGPSGPVRVDLDISPRGGKGLFIPDQVGYYEVRLKGSVYPSVCICLSVYLSSLLSVCLPFYLFVCLPFCLDLFVYPPVSIYNARKL